MLIDGYSFLMVIAAPHDLIRAASAPNTVAPTPTSKSLGSGTDTNGRRSMDVISSNRMSLDSNRTTNTNYGWDCWSEFDYTNHAYYALLVLMPVESIVRIQYVVRTK